METKSSKTLIADFRKRIGISRNLAEETETFLTEIEKLNEDVDTKVMLADIIQDVLDREPDANLRSKFQKFVEIIKRENGKVTKDRIELGLIGR